MLHCVIWSYLWVTTQYSEIQTLELSTSHLLKSLSHRSCLVPGVPTTSEFNNGRPYMDREAAREHAAWHTIAPLRSQVKLPAKACCCHPTCAVQHAEGLWWPCPQAIKFIPAISQPIVPCSNNSFIFSGLVSICFKHRLTGAGHIWQEGLPVHQHLNRGS